MKRASGHLRCRTRGVIELGHITPGERNEVRGVAALAGWIPSVGPSRGRNSGLKIRLIAGDGSPIGYVGWRFGQRNSGFRYRQGVNRDLAPHQLRIVPAAPGALLAVGVVNIERLTSVGRVWSGADERRIELFAGVQGYRLPRRPVDAVGR